MTEEERRKRLRLLQLQQTAGGVSTDSEAIGEFKAKLGALGRGALQGATGRASDEAAGLDAAVLGITRNDDGSRDFFNYEDSFADRFRGATDSQRAANQSAQEAEPVAYGGGEVIGGTAMVSPALPAATGPGLIGTAIRGGAIGAAQGGLIGAGGSDGRDGIVQDALRGAQVGAVTGAALPGVVHGAAAVKNAISDPVTGVAEALMKRGSQSKANRDLSRVVDRSGRTPDDINQELMRAAQEGQSEFRLMDALGTPGQRRISGLVRSGGDNSEEIAAFLQQRQAAQPERLSQFVDEDFGMGGATAAENVTARKAARRDAANTEYSAARGNATPVEVADTLAVIDDRISGMQGSNIPGDSIDAKLSKYRDRLSASPAPDGELSRTLSDFDRVLGVKQEVQDDIGAAVRAGRNNEARELKKLEQSLDAALEGASPDYRQANDNFARASREIEGVSEGQAMARPSRRAQDNAGQVAQMTPEERAAAAAGYGDSLLTRIEANASPTANRAKALASPKVSRDIGSLATNPERLGRRVERENTMFETQNRALQGSRTADNLQDIEQTGVAASGLGGALRDAANLQAGSAIEKIGGLLSPIAKGQTDETRQIIARALMSNNPQKALENAMRQKSRSEGSRRIVEALLRTGAISGYTTSQQAPR